MRRLIVIFLLCVSCSVVCAEVFSVGRSANAVAAVLQKKIPELSIDHLFEAKRGSNEWRYSFWTRAEKTWVSEVRIVLKDKNASSCDVDVQAVRIEGGLLWSSTKLDAASTAEWTAKLRELFTK